MIKKKFKEEFVREMHQNFIVIMPGFGGVTLLNQQTDELTNLSWL